MKRASVLLASLLLCTATAQAKDVVMAPAEYRMFNVMAARGHEKQCVAVTDGKDLLARFVALGAREVTLIGQNVNAYHAIGSPDGEDFAELLRLCDAVPGLLRLRFTTSHPHYFTHKVSDAFRDLRTLQPWLHLPVQAGLTAVLHAMAR